MAAPVVELMIIQYSQAITDSDNSLTEREAAVLAASIIATFGFIADAKSVLTTMKTVLKNVGLKSRRGRKPKPRKGEESQIKELLDPWDALENLKFNRTAYV